MSTPPPPSISPATSSAPDAPPARPFLRPNTLIASQQPILPKPITASTAALPQTVIYTSAHRGFPPRHSASRNPTGSGADHPVAGVPNPSGYIRNPSPMTFMTYAQGRPLVYVGDPAAAQLQVHHMRPPPLVHRPVGTNTPQQLVMPRPVNTASAHAHTAGTATASRSASSQTKIASLSSTPLGSEYKNSKEREKSRDTDVVMVHDRKFENTSKMDKTTIQEVMENIVTRVRLVDGGSNSLYSLCRSWVRNGVHHETQPNFGENIRLLPRPLPASMIAQISEQTEKETEIEDPPKEELQLDSSAGDLSLNDLLQEHIRRAKRVRTRLRKERLLRIERYKQRLSLLLPPPTELARADTPGN